MSTKILCLFSLIYLTALFTSGFALKCLVCRGDSNNYCKEGQKGEIEECNREIEDPVCAEMEGKKPGKTHIVRYGCFGLSDAKRKANKYDITISQKNECQSAMERGETITLCTCDNEDSCNGKYEWPEKEVVADKPSEEVVDNGGMSLAPISTIGIALFNILIKVLY